MSTGKTKTGDELAELIGESRYFGKYGAIQIFKDHHFAEAVREVKAGNFSPFLLYLNILYSAMSFLAVGGIFMKVRAAMILVALNYWARKLKAHRMMYGLLSAGERHILLSIHSAVLQALKKVNLVGFSVLTMSSEAEIGKILDAERFKVGYVKDEDGKFQSGFFKSMYGPEVESLLMFEGLLLQLHREGLCLTIPQDQNISQEIEAYCNHQYYLRMNENISGDMQHVIRLLRYANRNEKAQAIAREFGTRDQQNKSSMGKMVLL